MEATWYGRDLPVLDATVRLLEDQVMARVSEIADATGLTPEDVARALDAMDGSYVDFQKSLSGGDPRPWYVMRVYPAARQAVGQWPTPETLIDRLAEAFDAAAEQEADPKKQSRLREVASWLGQTGRDVAVEVASRVILRQSGMG